MEQIKLLDFRMDEMEAYKESKMRLLHSLHSHNLSENGTETLRCLLSLRMICDHGNDLPIPKKRVGTESSMTCEECSVSSIQIEGCRHHPICMNCIEFKSSQQVECEECDVNDPEVLPEISVGRFPHYQQPSTKVAALLQAVTGENTGPGHRPKQ